MKWSATIQTNEPCLRNQVAQSTALADHHYNKDTVVNNSAKVKLKSKRAMDLTVMLHFSHKIRFSG